MLNYFIVELMYMDIICATTSAFTMGERTYKGGQTNETKGETDKDQTNT